MDPYPSLCVQRMNYNQLTGEINGERSGLEIKALTVQINGERSGFEIKAHDIETYVWPHLRNKKDNFEFGSSLVVLNLHSSIL